MILLPIQTYFVSDNMYAGDSSSASKEGVLGQESQSITSNRQTNETGKYHNHNSLAVG